MRALSILLSLILWLTPAFQAFANTMASVHCRAQGHISATAPDAAHDSTHAQHHGDAPAEPSGTMPAGAAHANHGAAQQAEDAGHCKCGCICNLACTAGVALAPSRPGTEVLASEYFRPALTTSLPHSTHAVLQRPPITSES